MRWLPTPQLCKDRPCFIIGGGFSILHTDLSPVLRGKHFTIGINDAFLLGDLNICWFGDKRWHEWNEEKLKQFKGIVASCHVNFETHDDVRYLKRGKSKGIDDREGFVSWNLCSGSSAINLAYHLGARLIILIGFDMKPTKVIDETTGQIVERGQWHENHKIDYLKKGYNPYGGYFAALPIIAEDAKRLGVEILNATIDTVIPDTIFPRISLERYVGRMTHD